MAKRIIFKMKWGTIRLNEVDNNCVSLVAEGFNTKGTRALVSITLDDYDVRRFIKEAGKIYRSRLVSASQRLKNIESAINED